MEGPQSTTFEVEGAAPELAVLGVGSFEQHSRHLPLETDFFFAGRVSLEVAQVLEAFYLNPLPYSVSICHRGFAGTVTLKPDTLRRVLWDIAASLSDWGVRYLAVLNAHGGNFILNPSIREWNMERRSPRIMLIELEGGYEKTFPNLHACEVETSLMLHLAPEKVRLNRAVDFVPSCPRADLTHFGMKRISPEGVWGYPTRASAEKGRKWFADCVAYCLERVRSLRASWERGDR